MATQIHGSRQIRDGTITNDEVASDAAIATSKLADDGEFIFRDGSIAFTGDLDMNSNNIVNLTDPSNAQDAATKAYVDSVAQGLDVKESARVATTGNITLSGTQTIDTISLSEGDRVLVKDQNDAEDNGIYVVASGAWSRSDDADSDDDVNPGMFLFVEEGATYENTGWVLTTDNPITLGTTELTFTQFSGISETEAGDGLTKTGNTIDVVGGNGITANADDIEVNVDDTTIEISGDDLQVKDAGIDENKLNSSVAGDGITGGSGSALSIDVITREEPSGTKNGSNVTFTLANTPVAGTEMLYLNGLLQNQGAGLDYTISSATITFVEAPLAEDTILCTYYK
jgi:phage-related tail fiber protein